MLFTSRRLAVLISIVGLAGFTALTTSVVPARAGTIAVISCKNSTTGAPEPIEGWKVYWASYAFEDAGDANKCETPGAGLESYIADSRPQPGSTGPGWEYTPPDGDQIIGGTLAAVMLRGSGSGYIGATGISGPEYLFEGANVIASDEWVPMGQESTYTIEGHGGGHIWTYAFCEPPGATCPAGASNQWYWSFIRLTWSDVELSNNSTPTGTGFSGAPAGSGPVSGTQNLIFQAGDLGASAPGVYQVQATLDGQVVYKATPNTNEGKCVPVGKYDGGSVTEFAYAQPCKANESVTVPLGTTAVKDGTHELVITVVDAAGNESIVYSHQLVTDNAPIVLSPPTVSGATAVGSVLTGTNGSFSAPNGTGTLSAASGEWLRCSDAEATHCSPIGNATAPTYGPTAEDVGYYLVYQNVVSDSDGSTTSDSQPTVAVAPTGGSGSNGGGSGAGGSGGGASGAGGVSGSSSGGLTVVLPGSGSNEGSVLLGSSAKWVVSLRVSPTKVRRHSKIKLTGLVSTSPRPDSGKLIYLQARTVGSAFRGKGHKRHRVTVYGKWVTFQAFRAKGSGSFASSYMFKLGGKHTYQFQAVAPAEGQYRNPTGISKTITVREI